jgi:hypothetical protein
MNMGNFLASMEDSLKKHWNLLTLPGLYRQIACKTAQFETFPRKSINNIFTHNR